KPGEPSFAGVGPGATQHIGIELFKRVANVNFVYVPYSGGVPAINDLLGGHVTAVLQNYSEVVELVKSGKLHALAATSKKRIELLPDLPTVAELGYNDYEVEVWFGVLAPAKTLKIGRRACHLVHGRHASTRRQAEAPQSRALSGRHLR